MRILCKTIFSLLTVAVLLCLGCKISKSSKSYKHSFKDVYVKQFKLTYLQRLLIKSYNNSNDIQNILRFDKSGFTEPLLTMYDVKLIDSLTKIDNLKLATDSAKSIGMVAEGAEGKHVLEFVIEKIESRWLDSLANNRYNYAKIEERFP